MGGQGRTDSGWLACKDLVGAYLHVYIAMHWKVVPSLKLADTYLELVGAWLLY